MERFELAIIVLLVVLVMICVYIATSWTLWRNSKKKSPVEEWLDKNDDNNSAFRKGFVPEGEEGLPKITITPVQPRPDISEVRFHSTSFEGNIDATIVTNYSHFKIDRVVVPSIPMHPRFNSHRKTT